MEVWYREVKGKRLPIPPKEIKCFNRTFEDNIVKRMDRLQKVGIGACNCASLWWRIFLRRAILTQWEATQAITRVVVVFWLPRFVSQSTLRYLHPRNQIKGDTHKERPWTINGCFQKTRSLIFGQTTTFFSKFILSMKLKLYLE